MCADGCPSPSKNTKVFEEETLGFGLGSSGDPEAVAVDGEIRDYGAGRVFGRKISSAPKADL
jgi:hypothetical protein